jgi:hypothetical protein
MQKPEKRPTDLKVRRWQRWLRGICPKCGEELAIVDVTPDGFDVWGCPCGYKEGED